MLTALLLMFECSVLCFLGDLTVWGLYHVPILFLSRMFFLCLIMHGASFGG